MKPLGAKETWREIPTCSSGGNVYPCEEVGVRVAGSSDGEGIRGSGKKRSATPAGLSEGEPRMNRGGSTEERKEDVASKIAEGGKNRTFTSKSHAFLEEIWQK